MAEAEEGCLSLPGLYGDVRRPERIVLNAYDLAGQELTLELDGLFACAVQHEVDHLDGVLFTDRLSPTALGRCAFGAGRFRKSVRRPGASAATFPTTKPSSPGSLNWKNFARSSARVPCPPKTSVEPSARPSLAPSPSPL